MWLHPQAPNDDVPASVYVECRVCESIVATLDLSLVSAEEIRRAQGVLAAMVHRCTGPGTVVHAQYGQSATVVHGDMNMIRP